MKRREGTTVRVLLVFVVVLAGVFAALLVYNTLPAQRVKRQLSLGQKYLDEQDYDQAVLAFEAAIKIDPKKQESHALLGNAYRGMAEQLPENQYEQKKEAYEQAADAYRDAQVLVPEDVDTYNQLITVYEELILLTEVQEPEKSDEYQKLKTETENAASVPTAAPVTRTPVTDAPVTKPPVTEAPTREPTVPVTETPVTEVPVTDTPVTEVPVTDTPVTDVPVTESPEPEPTGTEEDDISEVSEASASEGPTEVPAEYTLTQPDLILSQEPLDIVTLITGVPRADKDRYHLQYVYAPQKSRGIGITGETKTWLLSACQYDFDGNGREDIFAVLFEGAGTVQEDNNLVFTMLENDENTGVWKESNSRGLEFPIVEMSGEQNIYIGRLEDGSAVILTEDIADGVVNISGYVYANGEFQTWDALQDHENNSVLESAICVLRCGLLPENGNVYASGEAQEWDELDQVEVTWTDMTGENIPQPYQEESEQSDSPSTEINGGTEEVDGLYSYETPQMTASQEVLDIARNALGMELASSAAYDMQYVYAPQKQRGYGITGVQGSTLMAAAMLDVDGDLQDEIMAVYLEGAGTVQEDNNLVLAILEQNEGGSWNKSESRGVDFPIAASEAGLGISVLGLKDGGVVFIVNYTENNGTKEIQKIEYPVNFDGTYSTEEEKILYQPGILSVLWCQFYPENGTVYRGIEGEISEWETLDQVHMSWSLNLPGGVQPEEEPVINIDEAIDTGFTGQGTEEDGSSLAESEAAEQPEDYSEADVQPEDYSEAAVSVSEEQVIEETPPVENESGSADLESESEQAAEEGEDPGTEQNSEELLKEYFLTKLLQERGIASKNVHIAVRWIPTEDGWHKTEYTYPEGTEGILTWHLEDLDVNGVTDLLVISLDSEEKDDNGLLTRVWEFCLEAYTVENGNVIPLGERKAVNRIFHMPQEKEKICLKRTENGTNIIFYNKGYGAPLADGVCICIGCFNIKDGQLVQTEKQEGESSFGPQNEGPPWTDLLTSMGIQNLTRKEYDYPEIADDEPACTVLLSYSGIADYGFEEYDWEEMQRRLDAGELWINGEIKVENEPS